MPAVVVTGARQTGKSTLVEELLPGRRRYVTLDDFDVLDAARRDPETLLGGKDPITLDEVQREPRLLLAVKRAIDRNRQPGRFLLTGSANLLLMRRVAESLAGRASYSILWPMTQAEIRGQGRCGSWVELLRSPATDWIELLKPHVAETIDWRSAVRRGGYPTPALQIANADERGIWFEGYLNTYLERDLQALSSISTLPDFRRLMRATCLRIGQLLNQTELGRDVGLSQPTAHRWLNLLESSYQLIRLPAFADNRTKRLIKSPKLYWADVGLAMHVGGATEPTGAHLENLILMDLLVFRDLKLERTELCYWRTTTGEEVDFVLETDRRLLPVEVKSTAKPRLGDAQHLISFRREYPDRAEAGLLLHCGQQLEWLCDGVLAAPWWSVL
jgi:predicted AAA+ superfamily ATPase